MGLCNYATSCLILMLYATSQASPLPINNGNNNNNINNNNNDRGDEILNNRNPPSSGSYYYSSTDYGGNGNAGGGGKVVDVMDISSSASFTSQQDFGDYSPVTTLPEDFEFESEKINPNQEKIIGKHHHHITTTTTTTSTTNNPTSTTSSIDDDRNNNNNNDFNNNNNNNNSNNNKTQQPPPSSGLELPSNNHHEKFSKLLFSSPSATVTSNGPSGPFKAIICHDCENSEGRNVGHSVSFSAIKSWNVGGKSKVATVQLEADANRTTSITTTLVKDTTHPHPAGAGNEQPATANQHLISSNNNHEHEQQKYLDENEQIEVHDNVELFKVTNTPSSVTEKPKLPTRSWNFSSSWHLGTSSSSNSNINNNNNVAHRKPIFTDLLKVPYDVLNAPLTEPPSTTTASTTTSTQSPQEPPINQQIHINHQQKFNDTITSNYQHFQQFIHKNLNTNVQPSHYQSTAMPEQNYEVDESVSLMSNGRVHGVQSTTSRIPSAAQNDKQHVNGHLHHHTTHHHSTQHNQHQHQFHQPGNGNNNDGDDDDQEQDAKFGYVVEGRNFRKYRVEEKTADGFIVGEYGLLSNMDGSPIQGVRYTADSNINPRLIYDALLKFLSL